MLFVFCGCMCFVVISIAVSHPSLHFSADSTAESNTCSGALRGEVFYVFMVRDLGGEFVVNDCARDSTFIHFILFAVYLAYLPPD